MKISVLGAAGSIGAPVSFNIAASGSAEELLMVDVANLNVLEHHALDIRTAASFHNVTVKTGGYEDLSGTDIIINCAGAHVALNTDRREKLRNQTRFISDIALKIQSFCPDAIVITVVNPVDAMNYATCLAGDFDRRKVIGYTINDSLRFKETLAKVLNAKPNQIDALVIGEHGSTQVPLFSSVKMHEKPVEIPDDEKRKIRSGMFDIITKFESLRAGRTAGWTCAIGLTMIIRAIIREQEVVLPCSVVLDGEYGQSSISMSVPVLLDRNGVKEIVEYDLTPDEQKGLTKTVESLQSDAVIVREALTSG